MNRTLISILILALGTSVAFAGPAGKGGKGQGMRGTGPGQGERMMRIQQDLGLSNEQVEQIQAIRRDGGSRDDIRAVLTEDQRNTLDEHRAARQSQGQGQGQGRRGGRGQGNGLGAGQTPVPEETGDG